MEFRAMPKIGRWYRDVVISEKIDGTNASILIEHVPAVDFEAAEPDATVLVAIPGSALGDGAIFTVMRAGSRTRWLMPDSDNFGFARWVYNNAAGLLGLGAGHHFGEWWGVGIQRGYDLSERRFSLFNAGRWVPAGSAPEFETQDEVPAVPGLGVVPVLYRGALKPANGVDPVDEALRRLSYGGSLASPRFMRPEGVMVWHEALRTYGKATLEGDGHKGEA